MKAIKDIQENDPELFMAALLMKRTEQLNESYRYLSTLRDRPNPE